ncbi:MAG TPA: hypothetical protein VK988_19160 [Acidimicrobiales bacterium]|nr:hypothetical protein [Acidimicrobiales bacterium]
MLRAELDEASVHPGGGWTVEVDGGSAALSVKSSKDGENGWLIEALLNEPLMRDLRSGPPATEVRAEIINFMDVDGSAVRLGTRKRRGRVRCWVGDLELTIDPAPAYEDARRLLNDEAFALTHVASVRRRSGAPITPGEFDEIEQRMFRALSFAAGSYVGIGCAAGFANEDVRCWERWTAGRVQAWGTRLPWLASRPAQDLESFLPKFWALLDSPAWAAALPGVVGSLAEGMRDNSIDVRLPTLITGLELFLWTLLVSERQLLNDSEFEGLKSAGALNLVLGLNGIPREVSSVLTELKAFALKSFGGNGPRSLIAIRNRVVHPPSKNRERPQPSLVVEAWRLAVWYLELLVLHRCDYRGSHLTPWAKAVWDNEPVPWADG